MPHIRVDRDTLEITLVSNPAMEGFSIPTIKERTQVHFLPMHRVVYELVYEFKHAEDRARGITSRKYLLSPPDPWLVAIAAVMWEGLVQGLTWDAVRISVLRALDFLRSRRLAPQLPSDSVESHIRAGFAWTKFSRDGKPLHDLFLGIEREYKRYRKRQRPSTRRSRRLGESPKS